MDDREVRTLLKKYELHDVQETGKTLGVGSYAEVVEVEHLGLRCAAKKLHRVLVEQRIGTLVPRFEKECGLLSHLRHPNIVQFIGIYFERGSTIPVLVMEFLPTNLAQYLEHLGGPPCDNVAYSVLHDVALGLRYLHGQNPPIVHRDLSANNVLLGPGMSAKISDLGVAKILSVTPLQKFEMTKAPGTPCYMPPEALVAAPTYSTEIDVFSYGVLMIHIFSGQWPLPTMEAVDPHSGDGRSEFVRRQQYINAIGLGHPLTDLITRCIHNNPENRPKALDIHVRIAAQQPYQDAVEEQLPQKDKVYTQEPHELESLQLQLAELEAIIQDLKATVAAKEVEMNEREQQIMATFDVELQQKEAEIALVRASMESEIRILKQQCSTTLNTKEKQISTLQKSYQNIISSKNELISCKEDTIARYTATVQALHDQLAQMQRILSTKRQSHLMCPDAELMWRQCANLPAAITNAQATSVNRKVYVGGGDAGSEEGDYLLLTYNPATDEWSTMATPCPVKLFGLAQLLDMVTLVGGIARSDGNTTNDIYLFDEDRQAWMTSVPPMPTARHSVTAAHHKNSLIVIGGTSSSGNLLKEVEVFNGQMWSAVDSLPYPCRAMSCVVHDGICYLMGGTKSTGVMTRSTGVLSKSVLCANIAALTYDKLSEQLERRWSLSRASSRSSLSSVASGSSTGAASRVSSQTSLENPPETWSTLADVHHHHSSVAILAGCLVAIGGSKQSVLRSTVEKSIHAYCHSLCKWVHVGDLPSAVAQCASILLPTGDIMVIGGTDTKLERSCNVLKGYTHHTRCTFAN